MKRKIILGCSIMLFLFTVMCICPTTVFAKSEEHRRYYMDSYDINVIVNEDHTFDITETIKLSNSCYVDMLRKKILLKNSMSRFVFTDLKTTGKISDVSVDSDFSVDLIGDGNAVIEIDKNSPTTLNGNIYKIKYKYENMSSNTKEMLLNLINADKFDKYINIKRLNFSITMPKDFDPKEFHIYKDMSKVDFSVSGNTITGYIDNLSCLDSGSSVDIYAHVPDGYFVNKNHVAFDIVFWIQVFVPIICLLISFFVYLKYGRNPKLNVIRKFYPPLDINSSQMNLIYRGGLTNPFSLNSLFIYFANKGFIKIKSYNKRRRKISYEATKKYIDDEAWENIFFNKFFNTTENLKEKEKEKRIKKAAKTVHEKTFEKIAKKKDIIILSLLTFISFSFFGGCALLFYMYIGVINVIITLLFGALSLLPILLFLISMKESFTSRLMLSLCAGIIMIAGFCFSISLNNRSMGTVILIAVCVLAMVLIYAFPGKRTSYGLKTLEDIKGFKNFIKTATEQEIRQLIISDPDYIYKILPYMYALRIPKSYMDKFEFISVKKPNWYTGKIDFDLNVYSATKLTYDIMDALIPRTIIIPIPI